MHLLLINGASGSGKTTLARALSSVLDEWCWVHPDELLPDTPRMGAEEILEKSLCWANANVRKSRVVIDCQIRPTALGRILQNHSIDSCDVVLLTCPRAVREQRLLDRGWPGSSFERIERWAKLLRNESAGAGMQIFDTSLDSVDSICLMLKERLRNDT